MGELLPSRVVAAVAKREGVPLLVAQDLAARAVLNAGILSERRHRNPFPKLERAQNLNAIHAHILEREESKQ